MGDVITIAKGVVEIGFSAAAVISVFVMLWVGYYKLIPAVAVLTAATNQLVETVRGLSAKADTLGGRQEEYMQNHATHAQMAVDMHSTCIVHGKQLDEFNRRLQAVETKLGV